MAGRREIHQRLGVLSMTHMRQAPQQVGVDIGITQLAPDAFADEELVAGEQADGLVIVAHPHQQGDAADQQVLAAHDRVGVGFQHLQPFRRSGVGPFVEIIQLDVVPRVAGVTENRSFIARNRLSYVLLVPEVSPSEVAMQDRECVVQGP